MLLNRVGKFFNPAMIIPVIFIITCFDASAYTCRNKQTGKTLGGGSSSVSIPLSRTLTSGEQVVIDIGKYYECKNDTPAVYSDYMFTQSNSSTTVLSSAFDTGAYIKGGKYAFPLPEVNVFTLPKGGDSAYHNVPISIFYEMKDSPGELVKITKGQTIATLMLHKYATTTGGPQDRRYFTWNIIADNDSIFTSGTCEINGGRNIDIDFGQIAKQELSESGISSTNRRRVDVPYKCKNPVNMPISITLSADIAAFSIDSIKTSNENLGVQMYYGENLISPGKSVHLELQNGIGNSLFDFALVKNRSGAVSSGPFSGSAVLVMSAD
ncbi:fimbrial protein [Pectobacterium betavasculorum]|uniref:Fimbrial protein n=1 Tax=Pectobacterium betavasculorum TaxID=55207 RepID=A0ABR4UUQ8_9GAMM|nr:fimbrial protein [Pectobacterium betavasculorum]KFX14321.1 hypothetical protein JV35_19270 [Pectobacterium betavasculorum]